MRITVVSAQDGAEATEALRDLGCAVREVSVLAPPEEMIRSTDAVVVEAKDDGEVGRFAVQRLRAISPRVPILLAIRTSQLTRLDPAWGHDDFVLQPFVPQELYLRLRGAEWRGSEFAQAERIKVGPLLMDLDAHEATLAGSRLDLPPQEFALLAHLARHRTRVLTREVLLRDVWGLRGVHTRTVDVHVRRLRAKLGAMLPIETVHGIGYRLRAP